MKELSDLLKKQLEGTIRQSEFLRLKELFFETGEAIIDQCLYDAWIAYTTPQIYDKKHFEEIKQSIKRLIRPENVKKARRIQLIPNIGRWAAVIALMLSSTIATYWYASKNNNIDDVKLVECVVPEGEMRTITLPDSSKVKVNSGSILIYPETFGKTRNIYLNGEAYFSVTHDRKKPFIVKTMDFDVEVLGTVFNVSSYIDDTKSIATLQSGKVKVNLKNDNNSIILQPDEQLIFDRKKQLFAKKQVDITNAIAWTKGNLIIYRNTLEEIAKIIERKYAMRVYLNTSRYPNDRLTMKFSNNENINEFMSIMRLLVPNLKYKIEGEALYIY